MTMRYHGPHGRGYSKILAALRRREAESRNAATPHARRRATRRSRARRGRS